MPHVAPSTDPDPWWSYLAPVLAFGLVTSAEGYVSPAAYPWIYGLKLASVMACFAIWPAALGDLPAGRPNVLASIAVGVLVFLLWIGVEELIPYPHLGERVGFDPTTSVPDGGRLLFLVVRFFGLVAVVPLMEELFWRSLALRYLTNQHFHTVPIGEFSRTAFWVVVVLFAGTHTEWLVAAATAAIYALWVRQTKSILAAVIAHATTNAALGAYVLATGKWYYW